MTVSQLAEAAQRDEKAYAHGQDRPLGGYAVLVAVYAAISGGLALLVGRRRKRGILRPPDRIAWQDLALISTATHCLSRRVTKDSVTSVVRAPFTEFEEPAGDGEVNEGARGTGLRHAVGELLTCPFCIAQWIATVFGFGLVLFPRTTRFVAATLTAVTASDWLQFARTALQKTDQ